MRKRENGERDSIHTRGLVICLRVKSAFHPSPHTNRPPEFGFSQIFVLISCMSTPSDANSIPDGRTPSREDDEADEGDRQPAQSRCSSWKFSMTIDLSVDIPPPPCRNHAHPTDPVELVELALQHFMHSGPTSLPFKGAVAQFDANSARQSPHAVSVTGYVQLEKQTRKAALQKWIQQCDWTMVPGGLGRDSTYNEFKRIQPPPCVTIHIGEIGLDNAGRQQQKLQKVDSIFRRFSTPHLIFV